MVENILYILINDPNVMFVTDSDDDIRCIAELYDVFKEQAVLYIRESPQVLTSASGDQPSLSFMSDQGYRAISKGLSIIDCKNNVNFIILLCFVIFYVNYKKMFR